MKPSFIFLFSFLTLLTVSCFGQTLSKKYSLPGFVQLNDTLFISTTEIDIREYGRFLTIEQQIIHDSLFIYKAMPSTNYLGWKVWSTYDNSLITFAEQYEIVDNNKLHSSISFSTFIGNCPVVNVTKEQANLYCDFRNFDYQFFYRAQPKRKKKRYPVKLEFRIPTASEWIYAASAGLDTLKNKYGIEDINTANQQIISRARFEKDSTGQLHPFNVTSGFINNFKILNMCGNVAELVADSDFVYGGSFSDPVIHCTATSKELFTIPQNNIGFRVVAVIKDL